jgi:hypothetical protein
MLPLALGAAAAAAGACGAEGPPPAPAAAVIDDAHLAQYTLTLTPGQVGDAGALSILFRAVTEDSRCPIEAVCVRLGNARVELRVAGHSQTADTASVTLNTIRNDGPTTAAVGRYEIELVSLTAQSATQPRPYEAVVRVVRR